MQQEMDVGSLTDKTRVQIPPTLDKKSAKNAMLNYKITVKLYNTGRKEKLFKTEFTNARK